MTTHDTERLAEANEFLDVLNNRKIENLTSQTRPTPSFADYMSHFTSKYNRLPRDSINPYEDDVIDYANRPPLQLLLIGKPRSGRTTFSKALAK